MMGNSEKDADDEKPEDSPLVASAVDSSVSRKVVEKTAQRHTEEQKESADENLARMIKEDPTIIPGINDIAKVSGPEEREVATVKHAPKEGQEEDMRKAWIKDLQEARDASRHLENTSELSKFIQAQQASSMACHAKQLEAKRTLDGIASKVLMLSDEVEGQEALVEAQSQMVKDMLSRGARSAESKKAEHHQCNVNYNESWDNLRRFRNEIIELHNIAN